MPALTCSAATRIAAGCMRGSPFSRAPRHASDRLGEPMGSHTVWLAAYCLQAWSWPQTALLMHWESSSAASSVCWCSHWLSGSTQAVALPAMCTTSHSGWHVCSAACRTWPSKGHWGQRPARCWQLSAAQARLWRWVSTACGAAAPCYHVHLTVVAQPSVDGLSTPPHQQPV